MWRPSHQYVLRKGRGIRHHLFLFFHMPPPLLSICRPLTTTETFETIKEFVAPEFIPVEYGGLLKYSEQPDSCRRQSPEEVRMREFVLAVNKRHGVEMVKG